MVKFIDGPAKGQTLMLHRVPILLRVTQAGSTFDALNELHDEAHPRESIHAYVMVGKPSPVHIRARKGGGTYWMAEYRLLDWQPSEPTLRDNDRWMTWCQENRETLTPAWAKEMNA